MTSDGQVQALRTRQQAENSFKMRVSLESSKLIVYVKAHLCQRSGHPNHLSFNKKNQYADRSEIRNQMSSGKCEVAFRASSSESVEPEFSSAVRVVAALTFPYMVLAMICSSARDVIASSSKIHVIIQQSERPLCKDIGASKAIER